MANRYAHEWEQKIAQPRYDAATYTTYYPHPGRTRLGEHCKLCGVARNPRNGDEDCQSKTDFDSPHFVWPEGY